MATYDVIVLGLGAMGSAATCHLAARSRVLGLDRHTPAHDRGSSHGESRIIRQAYFEHPDYVPLLLRSYELWQQLERDTGRQLLTITGGLMMGHPESEIVSGSIRTAREHSLPYTVLNAAEISRRFPPFTPDEETIGVFESAAGFLRPEDIVSAYLDRAAALGAELHFTEPVVSWSSDAGGVRVDTLRGSYEAGHLVIASGPWSPEVTGRLGLPLVVKRQVMFWFDPEGGIDAFLPDRFPIYMWELAHPPRMAVERNGQPPSTFYGFPAVHGSSGGVKVALHGGGTVCTPETIDREVHAEEVETMRGYLADHLPALNARFLQARTCMYTNTPDTHFVIGRAIGMPNVLLAVGFSGHGFKFASVIGEILAELVCGGHTRHSLQLFAPERFAGTGETAAKQIPAD